MAVRESAEQFLAQLPGWEIVIFVSLVLIVTVVSGILVFNYLSKLRWNYFFTALEDTAGRGLNISKRGRCRLVGVSDSGEELFLLKGINKYRAGYGKRIGHNQILWVVAEDGYWYQSDFADFNKKLRELGLRPVSTNARFTQASIRKLIELRNPENKSFLEKYGNIILGGIFIISLLILFAMIWYSTNKQVQIASINAETVKVSKETQEINQKTLASIDNILSRLNLNEPNNIVGGSGLTPIAENG